MLNIHSLPTLPGASKRGLYSLCSRHFESPCDYAYFVKRMLLSWNWSNLGFDTMSCPSAK